MAQIHELSTFTRVPTSTDYLVIDDGITTQRIAAPNIYEPMTQAEIEAGTDASSKTVTAAAIHDAVQSLGASNYVDIETPEVVIDTSAGSSTTDGMLTAAITALGWLSSVVASGRLKVKELLTSILQLESALSTEYVVKTGTSGSWRYRKYNTGRFEAWYNVSTTITLNTALAGATGWYRNASAYSITAPSAIGGTLTVTHADIHPITGLASTMAVVTALSGATVSYYVISPAASSSAIASRTTTMTAYVQGTWS